VKLTVYMETHTKQINSVPSSYRLSEVM